MDRTEVVKIANNLVAQNGLINLTRKELCERADIKEGSFQHVMGCNFVDFLDEIRPSIPTFHKVDRKRVDPKLRRQNILDVALELSRKHGYANITRDQIAKEAGVSMGLVSKHFGTMIKLRRDIVRAAIHSKDAKIVSQAIANQDKHAKKAPEELKREAVALLTTF